MDIEEYLIQKGHSEIEASKMAHAAEIKIGAMKLSISPTGARVDFSIPASIPFGRLNELQTHPEAHLLAVLTPDRLFSDYRVKRYTSRLALETFLKNPGKWHAVIKNKVAPSMLIYPAFQI